MKASTFVSDTTSSSSSQSCYRLSMYREWDQEMWLTERETSCSTSILIDHSSIWQPFIFKVPWARSRNPSRRQQNAKCSQAGHKSRTIWKYFDILSHQKSWESSRLYKLKCVGWATTWWFTLVFVTTEAEHPPVDTLQPEVKTVRFQHAGRLTLIHRQ